MPRYSPAALIGVLVRVCLCLGSLAGSASAQELLLADRAPRFLRSAPSDRAPVEIDASSIPVLRRVVSLNIRGATVGRLLAAIERQTGLEFQYSRAIVAVDRPVSLRADSISVAGALNEILFGAGVDVLLTTGRRIALVRRASGLTASVRDTGSTIVGRVTDRRTGAPIAGATVVLEDSPRSVTTGSDGRYRMSEVAPGTYTLRVRYIGYTPGTASVTVTVIAEATADVALERSAQPLEEVVTTGTVAETQVKAVPTPVTVITADEIKQKNVQHVDQLFRGDVPGTFAWDTGILGFTTSFASIRGSTDAAGLGDHYKVYVDGVETADDDAFLANLDPSAIDRIEIVRGPQASTLYGAQALNGVIQIFTKKGTLGLSRPQVEAKAAAGIIESQFATSTVAAQEYSLQVSGGGRRASYHLGGTYRKLGQYAPEFGDEYGGVTGGARVVNGPLTAEFSARYLAKTVHEAVNPLSPAPAVNNVVFDGPQQAYSTTVTYRATPRWQHTVTLGIDRAEGNYISPQTNPAKTPSGSFSVASESRTSLSYHTTLSTPIGSRLSAVWTAGADHWVYNNEATFVQPAGSVTGVLVIPPGAGLAVLRRAYTNTGYFGQLQLGLHDALFLTAGLRGDQNDNFGTDIGTAWAPRIGLAATQHLGAIDLKVRASYGTAIRPPGVSQGTALVVPGTVQLANPDLRPEHQSGFDAGVELYAGRRASLQVTYYHQTATDLIEREALGFDPATASATVQYLNVGQVRNTGWEFEGSVTPIGALTLSGSLSIANTTVTALGAGYTGLYVVGDRLLGVPHVSGGASLSYALPRTTLSAGVSYADGWINTDILGLLDDVYLRHTISPPRTYWMNYPGIVRLHASVTQQLTRQVSMFAQVDNLTNRQTGERDNLTLTAGRMTTVGVKVTY